MRSGCSAVAVSFNEGTLARSNLRRMFYLREFLGRMSVENLIQIGANLSTVACKQAWKEGWKERNAVGGKASIGCATLECGPILMFRNFSTTALVRNSFKDIIKRCYQWSAEFVYVYGIQENNVRNEHN